MSPGRTSTRSPFGTQGRSPTPGITTTPWGTTPVSGGPGTASYNGRKPNLVRPCQEGWYIGAIDTSGNVHREYAGIGWMNYGHDLRYIAYNSLDQNDVSPHVYVVEYGK